MKMTFLYVLPLLFLSCETGSDPLAATRMMYNFSEEDLELIPPKLQLDNREFLLYTVDHEVFHCVDAYMHGFMYPQTFDPLKACGDRAIAELKSEIFSAMAHVSRNGEKTGLLSSLAAARTLALLDWDVEHFTHDVLHDISRNQLTVYSNINNLVPDAMEYFKEVRPTQEEYIDFLSAAWVVTQEYGLDKHEIPKECHVLEDHDPDPEKVAELAASIDSVLQAMSHSL